jgi:hypothetical protein
VRKLDGSWDEEAFAKRKPDTPSGQLNQSNDFGLIMLDSVRFL